MQTHDRRWIKTNYSLFIYLFEQGYPKNLITFSVCAIVIDYFNCNCHGTVQDVNIFMIQPNRRALCLYIGQLHMSHCCSKILLNIFFFC